MEQMHYLFVGNPGTGKSTMLNALTGDANFSSGFSAGEGKTKELQFLEHQGNLYMDTPGLEDVNLRKQAAQEISKALKRDGRYKIFFVVTLEAGRVRPADCATMKLVLDAAPEIGQNYAVILNKVSKKAAQVAASDKTQRDNILAALFSGVQPTIFVNFNPSDPDLEDEDNVVKPLPAPLEEFILNVVPDVKVTSSKVADVSADGFEQMAERFETLINDLRQDNNLLRRQLESQQKDLERQQRELAESGRPLPSGDPDLLSQILPLAANQSRSCGWNMISIFSAVH